MSKGSKKRPTDSKKFGDSYSRIFGEKPNFTGRVSLTKLEERSGKGPDIIFAGVDWPSKRFELQERQRLAFERNPYHTTLSDKRKQAKENQDEQMQKMSELQKKKTGSVTDV